MDANQWYHVFFTYDGSGTAKGIKLYVNGEDQELMVRMDSLRRSTIMNGNDFLAGNWNHRGREMEDLYGFKGGIIDEVYLYNRELSPVEVKYLAGNNQQAISSKAKYAHYLHSANKEFQAIRYQLDSLRRMDLIKPKIMVMHELDTVRTTYLLNRGAYDDKGNVVSRGTPKAILAYSETYPKNRLGLAEWLFSKNNPLVGRVITNRFWQLFFGRGIVSTPEDFGNQGALPSHPELLDWLAVNFREQGWDMKKLIKTIVLSATYRQDASLKSKESKSDPENRWLTRGPAQRLTAEMLRDQALVTSGLFYEKVGGKWVKPYQPAGIWKEMANQIGENKYRPSQGKDLYRRSLYSYWKRTIPPPSMLTFDAPERVVCSVKRQQTSTPLQSLVLLNDPLFIETSRSLAQLSLQQFRSTEDQITFAFKKVVSRSPKREELQVLLQLYQSEFERFNSNSTESKKLLNIGASPYDNHLNETELAAFSVVANAIFNLDEAKYR